MTKVEDHHEAIKLLHSQTIPTIKVINFLQMKDYKVESYLQKFPAEKGFLIDEPATEHWTFTATKEGETPSDENIFTKVFEREVRACLREFMKF